ncbi:conserved hypothetical protein [Xanthomonas phaseoli pv. phaseoli]|uniref:Uncharacterized protein n=1 Tax=Xanthomonas campestris pv. phaseoli TaxID=317013 RepID=A0AB38E768_XANCH|nr:conserved hypothetical protein [Xanthomonas phaseoli pv. phaseoli]SON91709.1 conserved hypothetical protein [Xanthomonas phaseoli pv. phaseoli]SON93100.1 conserved hypothetical protein [Xanthomonas phaseoli pv. phaseoli]SOO30094.1 conserved hypothetical protein [Xanthomonas phaseoli pv. phaseoli]
MIAYFDRNDRPCQIFLQFSSAELRMQRIARHARHKLRGVSRRSRSVHALQAVLSPFVIQALLVQTHRQHRLRRHAQGSRRGT